MKRASILKEITYKEDRPSVSVLLESDFTKEIRIVFKAEQGMKEHKTSFPIVVEVIEGQINFGASGEIHALEKGDIISLEASVPHDVKAVTNSIIRLTLFKADNTNRVEQVVNN